MPNKAIVPKNNQFVMDSDIEEINAPMVKSMPSIIVQQKANKISVLVLKEQNKNTHNIHGKEDEENQIVKLLMCIPNNLPFEFLNIEDFLKNNLTALKRCFGENCKLICYKYDGYMEDVTKGLLKHIDKMFQQPYNHNAELKRVSISFDEFEDKYTDETNNQLAVIDDIIFAYEIKAREENNEKLEKLSKAYKDQLNKNTLVLNKFDEKLTARKEEIINLLNGTAKLLQKKVATSNIQLASKYLEHTKNIIRVTEIREEINNREKKYPNLVNIVIQKRIEIDEIDQDMEKLEKVKKRNEKLLIKKDKQIDEVENEINALKLEFKHLQKGKPSAADGVAGHNLPAPNGKQTKKNKRSKNKKH